MRIDELGFSNEDVLDRICEAYGFALKVQLARHFEIASSSLANRYSRDSISYDFIVHCALETGASLEWLLTGKGEKFNASNGDKSSDSTLITIKKFTLSEGSLVKNADLRIENSFFTRSLHNPQCVRVENANYFIELESSLSDGLWLVDIEDTVSIRELTKLPGKKLHVAGGKVPFECGIDEIKTIGRVVGIYNEVN